MINLKRNSNDPYLKKILLVKRITNDLSILDCNSDDDDGNVDNNMIIKLQ